MPARLHPNREEVKPALSRRTPYPFHGRGGVECRHPPRDTAGKRSIMTQVHKDAARQLKALLGAQGQPPLSHSHTLEAVAAMYGLRDWNTLSAVPGAALLPTQAACAALTRKLAHFGIHAEAEAVRAFVAELNGEGPQAERPSLLFADEVRSGMRVSLYAGGQHAFEVFKVEKLPLHRYFLSTSEGPVEISDTEVLYRVSNVPLPPTLTFLGRELTVEDFATPVVITVSPQTDKTQLRSELREKLTALAEADGDEPLWLETAADVDAYLRGPALPDDPARLALHIGTDAESLSLMTLRQCRDAVRVALLLTVAEVKERSDLKRQGGLEWFGTVQHL